MFTRSSNEWPPGSIKLVLVNSLSCPPPGILSPGTLYPRVKCPPLNLSVICFFFYNCYSATYFIALKMIFLRVKSTMNGQNKNCSRFCTRAFWMYFTFVFLDSYFTAWLYRSYQFLLHCIRFAFSILSRPYEQSKFTCSRGGHSTPE